MKYKFNLLIVCLIFTAINTIEKEENIYNLTDSNFSEYINSNTEEKWILIFYLNDCVHCKQAIQSVGNILKISKLYSKPENRVNIGKIECEENNFICISYNIKSVPFIVKLENHKMIKFTKNPSDIELKAFIEAEHEVSEVEEIPQILNYFSFYLKILEEGLYIFNDFMNTKLKEFGFDIEWTIQLSIWTICAIILFIVTIEIIIISICCKSADKNILDTSKDNKEKDRIEDNLQDKKNK